MNRAWLLAARPPTLWATFTPVVVGSALAAADDAFRVDAFVVAMLAALAIQVGVNFANDAADAGRGADTADRIGPPRAVASGLLTARQVWRGTAIAFGLAAIGGIYLALIAGWVVIAIGVASIVAALGYTSGPVPYGYRGLGEVFVFAFFGPVATVGSRYVHDGTAPLDAWLMSIPVGLLIAAILVANNVRDLDTDRAAGKRTLAVLLGRRNTRLLFAALVWGAFAVLASVAIPATVPRGALLGLAAAPLALGPVRIVHREVAGPALIGALKGTSRLQAAFGLLAAAGMVIGAS